MRSNLFAESTPEKPLLGKRGGLKVINLKDMPKQLLYCLLNPKVAIGLRWKEVAAQSTYDKEDPDLVNQPGIPSVGTTEFELEVRYEIHSRRAVKRTGAKGGVRSLSLRPRASLVSYGCSLASSRGPASSLTAGVVAHKLELRHAGCACKYT